MRNSPFIEIKRWFSSKTIKIKRNTYTLAEELKTYTKVCEFDDLGMLRKTEVHCAGTPILSDVITYKKNGENTTMCVANEKFTHNGSTRTRAYTTDLYGRVTAVSDTVLGNHTYEYDYRGFLVREDDKSFEYDGNGNITRAGDNVFTYDSVIKDRLMSVGGKHITYSESNPLNPKTYDGKTFEFEGRRLVRMLLDNKVVSYEYDNFGYRIQKSITEDNVTKVTKYSYNNGKLIFEDDGSVCVRYLYDENDALYGFMYDNKPYFYIKDFMQNIIGIVDKSGDVVVKYEYTAFGDLKSKTGNMADTVGDVNSFRYKGYYLDKETGYFYCKSRYYDPKWMRFINMDHPDIIADTTLSHNDKNVYTYCDNDPINRVDSDGEAWHILIGAAVGAITSLVTSLATEIVEYAKNGEDKEIDGWGILTSVVIGTAEGALMAACPGASIAISAGASALEEAIDGTRDYYTKDGSTTVREIVTNTLIAGAFGAAMGVGGSAFSKVNKGDLINTAVGSLSNAFKKGVHPVVKKAAKKAVKKAAKLVKNEIFEGVSEYAYTALQEFTSWVTNLILDKAFEK